MPHARYTAGVVHHQSYDDLERCLVSLASLVPPPEAVRVLDVDADAAAPEAVRLRAAHPGVEIEPFANRGYAGGCNRLVAWTADEHPTAEYALLLNPDVVLAPDFAARLAEALDSRPDVALACGKLLRPGGERIDSAGIVLPAHRRPRDRGAGEVDRGQYDRMEEVFAAGGAALWLRMSAVSDLAIEGELFDEDFFMYHEETDLCWRAGALGWKVLYVPAARAEHGRRWRKERRFAIEPHVRRHSFKNHYLQLVKNERGFDLVWRAPLLVAWEVLRLGHALLRDRAMLPAYGEAARLLPRAWRKRRALRERIRRRAASPAGAPSSG